MDVYLSAMHVMSELLRELTAVYLGREVTEDENFSDVIREVRLKRLHEGD